MGAHVRNNSAKKLVSSDFAKILNVATKIRETCEKTLFTPSSPVKATKLYHFCLSDKMSPKSTINILAIVINAREHLAIVHRKVASILSDKILLISLSLFSDKRSPKGIACLAIVVKAREHLAIVLRQVASIN
jgi:hypothetical protein